MAAIRRRFVSVGEVVRKDPVLAVALVLAVLSCVAVPPDAAYFGYIDLRTIGMLFSLMTVMAGLSRLGVFSAACRGLLAVACGPRRLLLALTLLAFFSSMLITNDVALVTFVPLALLALGALGSVRLTCFTVVMMTIAANLGSMFTPVGNPQNLYLYSASHMALSDFLLLMLPYTLGALALLVAAVAVFGRENGAVAVAGTGAASSGSMRSAAPAAANGGVTTTNVVTDVKIADAEGTVARSDARGGAGPADTASGARAVDAPHISLARTLPWLAVFVCALLSVARVLPFEVTVVAALAVGLVADRGALAHVDYALLVTFVAFFVFVGNMGRIEVVNAFIAQMVSGHELAVAVGASQVLSNVPAAILLSGFTSDWPALIVGTNVGGLGTLIASMASLISYKQIALVLPREKGRYFVLFTAWNVVFLVVLLVLHVVLELVL